MKRILSILAVLTLALSLSAVALAETAPEASTISVTGTATVALTSDTATIQIGAMTRALTVSEAQEENDGIMSAVQKALLDMGIDQKDMVTNSYNVSAELPYMEPGDIRPAETSYIVNNMLSVTVRDLSVLPKAIDAAAKAGANQIYSMEFSSSKGTEAYHLALTRAVEDGKAKAETLAKAAGKTLGELKTITSVDHYGYPYGMKNAMSFVGDDAGAASIVTGDINITASVTMIYEMK